MAPLMTSPVLRFSVFAMRISGIASKFLLGLFIANLMSLTDLGIYGLLQGQVAILPIVLRLGLNRRFARELTDATHPEQSRLITSYFSLYAVMYAIGLAVATALAVVGAIPWLAVIVIGLAFFLPSSSAARVVGFYPSPAGATASVLDLGAWERLTADHPPLGAPPQDPNDAKKYPQRAKQITIDVIGIETANNVTTVQLQEDVDGRKLKTSITCTADKFTVDPQSFFFAGEPGGAYHLEFTDFQHKDGTTLKLVGGKLTGPDWRDDVTGTWKQTPTQGADAKLWQGKLEIELIARKA